MAKPLAPWFQVGWTPEFHCMFNHECIELLKTTLMAGSRRARWKQLPELPPELWYHVFSFIQYFDYPIPQYPAPKALCRPRVEPRWDSSASNHN